MGCRRRSDLDLLREGRLCILHGFVNDLVYFLSGYSLVSQQRRVYQGFYYTSSNRRLWADAEKIVKCDRHIIDTSVASVSQLIIDR